MVRWRELDGVVVALLRGHEERSRVPRLCRRRVEDRLEDVDVIVLGRDESRRASLTVARAARLAAEFQPASVAPVLRLFTGTSDESFSRESL